MKRLDKILTNIACEQLGISTLKRRRSDALDFHNVAVWQLKAALTAAFEAGARAAGSAPEPAHELPTRFDDYEIHGVKRFDIPGQEQEPIGNVIGHFEQVGDDEPEFWSLFGHIPGRGLDCIGDFETRKQAEEVYARITGERYSD
jgi:hypothetical protein